MMPLKVPAYCNINNLRVTETVIWTFYEIIKILFVSEAN